VLLCFSPCGCALRSAPAPVFLAASASSGNSKGIAGFSRAATVHEQRDCLLNLAAVLCGWACSPRAAASPRRSATAKRAPGGVGLPSLCPD
jgi:hypothetical protein